MSPRPTDAELSILRVLWDRGPSTVRQVFDTLARQRDLGYTTVLKLLQIMTDKGLVARDDTGKLHVYRPSQSQESTQRHLLHDLMEKAYMGSSGQLVIQALSTQAATPEEMQEIRRLLDQVGEQA